eukprot:PhM_4_TR10541/c0_g1_i1/m.6076
MRVSESNATTKAVVTFSDSDGAARRVVLSRNVPVHNRFTSLWDIFSAVFLPEGYPNTVSCDYAEYQKWDTIQALCSSVTGTLSTNAILRGVGVGDAAATATSATMQWVLRDGTGMVGRVGFAAWYGSDFDNNAKTWRLVADITNDIAIMLEILSAYHPELFLAIVCVASVLKAVTGVAGGATRATLTQHFALVGNTADVSAKDGSQETAVGLIGMFLGMLVTWLLHESGFWTWIVFFLFTALHLYANFRGVSCVVLPTLNRQRAEILFDHFQKSGHKSVLGPTQVSAHERVVGLFHSPTERSVIGGSCLDVASTAPQWGAVIEAQKKSGLAHVTPNVVVARHCKTDSVVVLLTPSASTRDIIAGYYVCYCVHHGVGCVDEAAAFSLAASTLPRLLDGLERSGWSMERCQLTTSDLRCEW